MAKFEKKYTIEQLKEIFQQNNCELLQDYYDRVNKPVNYRCACGKKSQIAINNFIKGGRCRSCGGKKISKKMIFTIEKIKNHFEDNGYALLSNDYTGAHQKLSVICPKGHNIQISYGNFNRGNRCRHCFFESRRKPTPPKLRPSPIKHTYESMKIDLEQNGYKLLSTEFLGVKYKMKFECPNGHLDEMQYATFRRGARCIKCSREKRKGVGNWRWISDRVELKKNQRYAKVCRMMVKRTLKAVNEEKTRKTDLYLGYTSQQLKNHFENHPKMIFIGNAKWVPDHIFPIKAFIDFGISDISLINCLDNLQPLTESENHKKSDKYIIVEFKKFLESKNIFI